MPDPTGIHNLFLLGTNVYSGSSPDSEKGFAALADIGIKTIVTVDGAKPDIELARKYGLRYVHLPHGYDGISTNIQIQLSKVVETLPGPFYVHCHHGKHRGPAAAAVMCMANQNWSPAQAEAWLETAGTATNYIGLYDVVRKFKRPSTQELSRVPTDFPELAKVSGLTDAMVSVDERWDHLKATRAAGYQSPQNHPDLKPANEAMILWEHYREAQRLPDVARHGSDFIDRLKAAEAEAKEAEHLLRLYSVGPKPDLRAQLDRSFDAMEKTCASCHRTYRDAAGSKANKTERSNAIQPLP